MRKKIIKDTLFLNMAMLLCQGMGIVQTVLIMRFLDPYYYGIWMALNIVLMYADYFHLGVGYGFPIRLTYYQGQGKPDEAAKIADSGYFSWSLLTIICALGVLIYGVSAPGLPGFSRVGLAIIAIITIAEQQIFFFLRWQAAACKDFKICSVLFVARGVFSFIVLVPCSFFFNVAGLMGATMMVAIVFALVWRVKTSYRFQGRVNFVSIVEMIKVGFPTMLVCLAGKLIETVDRILIVFFLGSVSLGCYAVTAIGGNALYGLVAQAGTAMAPHIVEHFALNNDSPVSLKKFLVGPTIVFAYVMSALLMVVAILIPLLVITLLPKYVPGISAFYCFLPGFFFLGVILTANNILNYILISKGHQMWLAYFQVVPIFVQIGLGFLFIKIGWGIAGVALASTLSYALYGGGLLWWTSRHVLPDRQERRRFMGDVVLPFIYVLPVAWLIILFGQKFFPYDLILRGVVQLLACVVSFVPFVFFLNLRTGIFIDAKNIIGSVIRRFQGSPEM
ncbi:MAG: oligosaccharide flippase family protein [Candidatus Omnitrophica bacterium]|nr:oligosaccharide flippase family protein [Candidatus Omnitrophota bacterium]